MSNKQAVQIVGGVRSSTESKQQWETEKQLDAPDIKNFKKMKPPRKHSKFGTQVIYMPVKQ